MTSHVGVIVTDASPLITLAAAGALDLLSLPGLPVMIPDMVYLEVTRTITKLGAGPVIEWARRNRPLVRVEPTEVYAEYQALVTLNPATRYRDRGEQAAIEILTAAVASDPELSAVLLFEDSDISRRKFAAVLPERVMPMTTGGYLQALEAAGRIQSADQVLDQAIAKGRDVSKQRDETAPPGMTAMLRERFADESKSRR